MTAPDPIAAILDPIRERVAAASPGLWWTDYYFDDLSWREGHFSVLFDAENPTHIADPDWESGEDRTYADAEFIAHARDDIPRLLAMLDAVVALIREPRLVGLGGTPDAIYVRDIHRAITEAGGAAQ